MTEEPDLATVLDLLDDERARTILSATSVEPMSATELAESCDASLPTVYRRVERLADAGLLREHTRPRPDGHHDAVYEATLDHFAVSLSEGSFEFVLQRTEPDAVDQLAKLWERF